MQLDRRVSRPRGDTATMVSRQGVLRCMLLCFGIGAAFLVPRSPLSAPVPLVGQFLVASPRLAEPTFARSVIYVVAHTKDGAMGLMVNRLLGRSTVKKLVSAFGIKTREKQLIDIHLGGPVDLGRGFVLHSADYSGASTQSLDSGLSLSVGLDVMQALASGRGPKRKLFLFGYAGWGPGQLDGELARGDWMVAPVDEALIFSDDPKTIWDMARRNAGLPM